MLKPIHHLPASRLRPFISSYGILEVDEGITEAYFSPPIGMSGWIIQTVESTDRVIAKSNKKSFFTESAVVTGQVTTPIYGQIVGEVKCLLVFFKPLGMNQLFKINMATLRNRAIPLQAFLGEKDADTLILKLQSRSDSEQIDCLNDYFLSLVRTDQALDPMHEILSFIHSRRGGVTVKEIEQHCHCHRKTIERHFQERIGLTPKVYCKIYQFKCLMKLLQENPEMTWSHLSSQAGYFDQSHMSRYVKKYLEVSPSNIVDLNLDLINYLLQTVD